MSEIQVERGFEESDRARVGALYWNAFGDKLSAAFPDRSAGRRAVTATLRADRVLVARHQDSVVGVCGYYDDGRGAMDVSWALLRRSLSPMSTLWAVGTLSLLDRPQRCGVLVLDGICVEGARRGRGIGSRLIETVTQYARARGRHTLQLSVIDANPRAAALYRRHGFITVDRGRLGPLRHVFGFDGHATMQKRIDR